MRSLCLITPPVLDPRSTYLGISILAGKLAAAGVNFQIIDANVRFFDWFLSRSMADRLLVETNYPIFAALREELEGAKATLRGHEFYDDAARIKARNVLDLFCRTTGLRYPKSDLRLHSYSYGGVENSAAALLQAVENPELNPFDAYYVEHLIPHLLYSGTKYAAISITNNHQAFPALRLCRLLKTHRIEVIVGGASVTKMMENIKICPKFFDNFDYAVFFEGDEFISDFFAKRHSLTERKTFRGNFSFLQFGEVNTHKDLVPVLAKHWSHPIFPEADLQLCLRPCNVLPVVTSKGCSWGKCTFCTIPNTSGVGGGAERYSMLATVVNQIKSLQLQYECNYFIITDENMAVDRQVTFAKEIVDSGLKISWLSYSRFEVGYTDDVCQLLKHSGCKKLLIGLESTNNGTLKRMKKGISNRVIIDNLNTFERNGVPVHLYCMVGFPGQTIDDAIETLVFVLDYLRTCGSGILSASFSEFVLDKNSHVYLNPEAYGISICSDVNDDLFSSRYSVNDGTDIELWKEFRKAANKMIVAHFGRGKMVGWEEYSLLIDDYALARREPLEPVHLERDDFNSLEIKLHEAMHFSTCPSTSSGALIVNRRTFESVTVSAAVALTFMELRTGDSLEEVFKKFTIERGNQLGIFLKIIKAFVDIRLIELVPASSNGSMDSYDLDDD